MFAEKRRRTGRTKERSVNSGWVAGNTNPKLQAKLHILPPFPHPPSLYRSPGSHKESPWAQMR